MKQETEQQPILYIDIDGVLLANESNLAEGAADFIKYAADNFEVYWLTTHCMQGDPKWAVEYVNRAANEDLTPWLDKFKPTTWSLKKTDAVDMSQPFYWFDDDCFAGEKQDLEKVGAFDSLVLINLRDEPVQLRKELRRLRSIIEIS